LCLSLVGIISLSFLFMIGFQQFDEELFVLTSLFRYLTIFNTIDLNYITVNLEPVVHRSFNYFL
jgi:hypothetical protein